jgi:hypothetical protein
MNGGSDDNKGDKADLNSAYATVTKAIKDSFYGSLLPLIVDVGTGIYSDNKLNAGARGLKIIGKGIGITTMINRNKDNEKEKLWLASSFGGLIDVENMTLK